MLKLGHVTFFVNQSFFLFMCVRSVTHDFKCARSAAVSRAAGLSAARAFGRTKKAVRAIILSQLNVHYFYVLGGRFYRFMHSYWNVRLALSPTGAWIRLTAHLFLTLSGSGGNWSPNPSSVYDTLEPSEPGPTSEETSVYVLSRWH